MLYNCQQKIANKTVALDFITSAASQAQMQKFGSHGIELNNRAYTAAAKGDYEKAIDLYKKSIQIRVDTFGPDHYNVCIPLSGLAAAYLSLKDFTNARIEAERMKRIAQLNNSAEQLRIASETIRDINKATGNKDCMKCGKSESRFKCGKCLDTNYCSAECNRADWKIHKLYCGE